MAQSVDEGELTRAWFLGTQVFVGQLNDLSLIDKHLFEGVEVICGCPFVHPSDPTLNPGPDQKDRLRRFLTWIYALNPRAVAVDNTAAHTGGIEVSSFCAVGLENMGWEAEERRLNNEGWGPITDTSSMVVAARPGLHVGHRLDDHKSDPQARQNGYPSISSRQATRLVNTREANHLGCSMLRRRMGAERRACVCFKHDKRCGRKDFPARPKMRCVNSEVLHT